MKKILSALALSIAFATSALAGNTTLFSSQKGDIVFPFDKTTINSMSIGVTTPAAGKFTTLQSTGATTVGTTLGVTGAATLSSTLGVTGALTPTGGVVSAGGTGFSLKPYNTRTWQAITATSGTDTACTNGTAYVGSIQVPGNVTITGVRYLVGSVGGTDKVIVSLHDAAGNLLANSDPAGTTVGTTAQVQAVALTAPYAAVGPATYFVGLTFNGTTAKFRSVPAHTDGGVIGNSVTQTFGTPATFTAPTTFTADKVPVLSIY